MASLDSSEAFLLYGHHAAPPQGGIRAAALPRRSSGRSLPPQCDNDSKLTNLRSHAWQRF